MSIKKIHAIYREPNIQMIKIKTYIYNKNNNENTEISHPKS